MIRIVNRISQSSAGWSLRLAGLLAVPLLLSLADCTALFAYGKTSRAVMQGQTIVVTHVFSPKAKIEDVSLEVTKMISDLAKAYPSATAMSLKVSLDVAGAEDTFGSSDDGAVEIDQIKVDDLSQIRKCSGASELLYGDLFWLPSRLQKDIEQLKKRVESSK